MLRLPDFEYRQARSVREAVDAHAEAGGRAMYVAGGTDLLPNMKRRQFEPAVLVGLRGVAKMRESHPDDEGGLAVGAGVSLRAIATSERVARSYTALGEAAGQVANLQIQRAGTIGGNLCVDTRCNYYNQTHEWRKSIGFCMKKDGDICLVAPGSSKCWALSSSDTAPALMALGARVRIAGVDGEREAPVGTLYRDDGIEYLRLHPGEILTAVVLPAPDGVRSTYVKVRRRGSFDFPILGVGAAVRVDGDVVTDARLVLGAVHTHPVDVPEAGSLLVGSTPTPEVLDEVADAAYRRSTPLDNADLSLYWRKRVTRVTVRRALARLTGLDGVRGNGDR